MSLPASRLAGPKAAREVLVDAITGADFGADRHRHRHRHRHRQRHRHRRIFCIFTCYDDGGVLMVVVMVRYDNFRAFRSKCDQLAFRDVIFYIFTCYDDGNVLMDMVTVR